MEENLEKICEGLRNEIRDIGAAVLVLMKHGDFQKEQTQKELYINCHSEMKANIMLSYRHLEDARMRLGKVMQQIQGGVSKFDKQD